MRIVEQYAICQLVEDHLGVASRTASSPTHRGVTACLDSILATISLAFVRFPRSAAVLSNNL